ncbi:FAD binding domain protein [Periconia macrospinosa]|uniref:FAD binding domain protein n=1 Tax=Periconia macrospinosa TaxID=97972 RepID=A0A2V1D904_9PLEO|nr:FAD binding domain protein [Periconia macrospinosa]
MMVCKSSLLVVAAVLRASAAQNTSAFDLNALYGPGLSPGAEIIYSSDSAYAAAITPRWNLYDVPTYYGAIKPATEADVQHIVKVSVQHNISFLATGRGHGSTSTLGTLKNGIDIDLGNFRSVSVDNGMLTAGGAVNFSQLFEPVNNAGKMLPLGNSRCVGLVGATMGGTVGVLQGVLGLGVDYLESVRLVTATGDLIEASKTKNADLFWGIRGAGHNFGIITSATFRLHDLVNDGKLTSMDLMYPGSANKTIYEALQGYDNNIPNALTLNVIAAYNATSGEGYMVVNVVWFGPEADFAKEIQPFLAAGPIANNTKTVQWTNWWTVANFGGYSSPTAPDCVDGQFFNAYALDIKKTDPAAMTKVYGDIVAFARANPGFSGFFGINRYPETVTLQVPNCETAYGYRDTKALVTIQSSYHPNATLNDAANKLFRNARSEIQATSGFDHLAVYVNFGHGDEGPAVWYSPEKLENLMRLKRKWDPQERFSFYQPVPLHYPGPAGY